MIHQGFSILIYVILSEAKNLDCMSETALAKSRFFVAALLRITL